MNESAAVVEKLCLKLRSVVLEMKASRDVHASSRNILVANSTLVIKAWLALHIITQAYLRMCTSD